MKKGKPKSVEQYLDSVPKEIRGKLKSLRAAIKKAAPQAVEKISYGMPYYHYKTRLAYFRLATKHIGLYIPGAVLKKLQKDLKGFYAKGATVHLMLNKKIPKALIQKLIKARVKEIDQRESGKK